METNDHTVAKEESHVDSYSNSNEVLTAEQLIEAASQAHNQDADGSGSQEITPTILSKEETKMLHASDENGQEKKYKRNQPSDAPNPPSFGRNANYRQVLTPGVVSVGPTRETQTLDLDPDVENGLGQYHANTEDNFLVCATLVQDDNMAGSHSRTQNAVVTGTVGHDLVVATPMSELVAETNNKDSNEDNHNSDNFIVCHKRTFRLVAFAVLLLFGFFVVLGITYRRPHPLPPKDDNRSFNGEDHSNKFDGKSNSTFKEVILDGLISYNASSTRGGL